MSNNPPEIRDDQINVEMIMKKIRDKIRARKELNDMVQEIQSNSEYFDKNETDVTINRDLSLINSKWDIHNNSYYINSHRPFIGKFLIKGRQLIHGEVCRYVDPIISRQTEFNAGAVRIITKTSNRYNELNKRVIELEKALTSHKLETEKTIPIASHLDSKMNNFIFTKQFFGSMEENQQQKLEFMHYFEKCSVVLDIGCGRGGFLQILKNQRIKGIGIDCDPDMVTYCRSLKVEVEQSDAIEYLETTNDESLDGIFIGKVIEYMESHYLIRLLALCYQKMKSGSYIIVETVNPLSFTSFVNFNIDLTHVKPVHPETLLYLFDATGFRECEKKFFHSVPEDSRLKKIDVVPGMDDTERNNVDIYNQNIERLNSVLFGDQDYAVIGKK